VSLRYALASDCGRERDNNEDHALVVPELGLFVVADGMGGHAAGEVASRIAGETLAEVMRRRKRPRRIRDEAPLLGEAVLVANMAVTRAAEVEELHGMGTTLTAVHVRSRTATLAHVGDSRACLIHRGKLRRLTRDHTLVSLLVQSGDLAPEEAQDHPERHVLTQAIGPQASIEPEIRQVRLPRGSRILLSTDGLHEVVPEAQLVALASQPDLEAAVTALVESANALGGPDNITVILIEP
jgi:protein phosphatase